jgi:membrane associated rhomboid family serine protease
MHQPAASVILAATVALSLLGLFRMPQLIDRLLFRPFWFVRGRQYASIITSGFVHADVPHLVFNMITFWFFAFPLERTLGTSRFAVLYLLGLVLSHACSYLKHRDNRDYATLGASGAISAVLFAYIVYYPTQTLIIFPLPIPIPAALFAVLYVVYSWWAGQQNRGRINHDAHFCGALAGLLFVAVSDPQAYRLLLQVLL